MKDGIRISEKLSEEITFLAKSTKIFHFFICPEDLETILMSRRIMLYTEMDFMCLAVCTLVGSRLSEIRSTVGIIHES
jgi:hypothetical protein